MSSTNTEVQTLTTGLLQKKTRTEKIESKLEAITKLCKAETKSRIDSKSARISDSKASGLCFLKSKVCFLSDRMKDNVISIQSFEKSTSSLYTTVTEIRKRVNTTKKH